MKYYAEQNQCHHDGRGDSRNRVAADPFLQSLFGLAHRAMRVAELLELHNIDGLTYTICWSIPLVSLGK